jgi:ABC-type antimicrobial peptide transport system permease subunit
VQTVGWTSIAPLLQAPRDDFRIQAGAALTESVELDVTVISGEYFAAAGIELIEGRAFTTADGALSDPVAIVDERLARRYFGPIAVGHYLVASDGVRYKIVGVVRPKKYRALQDASRTTIYYPIFQHYQAQGHLLIQTKGDAAPHLAALERLLTRLDDRVAIQKVSTLERHLGDALSVERLTTTLVGLCGVLALAMAVLGAYGVMNDAVQRRTREIGLRVALGAAGHQVARVVLKDVLVVLLAGLGGGVVLSILLRRLIGLSVSQLPAFDVPTLTSAPALLTLIVALAAIFPLRRALRVSASVALRAE